MRRWWFGESALAPWSHRVVNTGHTGCCSKARVRDKEIFGSNAYGTKISLISGNGALLSSWGMVVWECINETKFECKCIACKKQR